MSVQVPADHLGGVVAAAVVHQDDLAIQSGRVHVLQDLLQTGLDAGRFVVRRDHGGYQRAGKVTHDVSNVGQARDQASCSKRS